MRVSIDPSVKVESRNGPSSPNLIYFEGQQLKIGGGVLMFLFLVSTLGDVLKHALLSLSETQAWEKRYEGFHGPLRTG